MFPKSTSIPLNPNTIITANVPVSAQNSAASIFPSYIGSSTTQLAVTLVQYFNNLPIKLPRKFAPVRQNPQTGAIQEYVYQQIASGQASSLKSVLLAITLPTTPGGDLQIYDAAVILRGRDIPPPGARRRQADSLPESIRSRP